MPDGGGAAWPRRFKVVARIDDGEAIEHTVATWGGGEDAERIVRGNLGGGDAVAIDGVEDLGPVARDDAGVARPERGDLIDRMEW